MDQPGKPLFSLAWRTTCERLTSGQGELIA
jgi:hypothetical protein